MLQRLKLYYMLTKPGIIRGNAIHVLAGALLASAMGVSWPPIIAVLLGTSFVIASACVANNYLDRSMDIKMKRTQKRASVTGEISITQASLFGLALLLVGFYILYTYTNITVVVIGIAAYLLYVFAYGFAKRHTVHSTLVGAIPGALPAMAGYVAVTGELSAGAWLVFLLIMVWQMPHFYAISIFRRSDYKAAGVPVLGVVRSFQVVKQYILFYMVAYVCVIAAMIYATTVSPTSGLILLAGAAYWLFVYLTTDDSDHDKWAKSIFGASLVLTLLLPLAAALNIFVSIP